MIHSQSLPGSCNSSLTSLCLDDGSYVLRTVGLCDPLSHNFSWSFCGVEGGGAFQQLEFEVTDGECSVLGLSNRDGVCGVTQSPSSSPTLTLSENPTSIPTTLTYHDPSSVPLSFPSCMPTVSSTLTPTLKELVTLPTELSCDNDCVVEMDSVGINDTCLFVTLMDQFGDGWQNGTNFSYWSDRTSNVISMTLGCGCPRMSGCIHPSDYTLGQRFDMAVVSALSELSVEMDVPEYFWEVHWTVQIVEHGEWKNKYFGGYNTSLSFEYSPSLQSFETISMTNVWIPDVNMSCGDKSSVMDLSSFLQSRVYTAGMDSMSKPYSTGSEASSYVHGGGGGYHESVWLITDIAVLERICIVLLFLCLF